MVAKCSPDDEGDEDEGLGEDETSWLRLQLGELEYLPEDDTLSPSSLTSPDIRISETMIITDLFSLETT